MMMELMTQLADLRRQNENLNTRQRVIGKSNTLGYSAEDLNKILEMQKDRIAHRTVEAIAAQRKHKQEGVALKGNITTNERNRRFNVRKG
jgi:hypothetical protein